MSAYWIKSDGSVKGEGLALKVSDFVAVRDIAGGVPALAKGCEPSTANADEELESINGAEHRRCIAHCADSSAGRIFDGKRVEQSTARYHSTVTRLTNSNQEVEVSIYTKFPRASTLQRSNRICVGRPHAGGQACHSRVQEVQGYRGALEGFRLCGSSNLHPLPKFQNALETSSYVTRSLFMVMAQVVSCLA